MKLQRVNMAPLNMSADMKSCIKFFGMDLPTYRLLVGFFIYKNFKNKYISVKYDVWLRNKRGKKVFNPHLSQVEKYSYKCNNYWVHLRLSTLPSCVYYLINNTNRGLSVIYSSSLSPPIRED